MNEIILKINELIDFVQKVSPTIWEIYYKQQIIYSIAIIMGLIISIIIFIICIKYLSKNNLLSRNGEDFEPLEYLITQIGLIISGTSIIVFLITTIALAIPHLLNPGYYAIQDLLLTIK